MLAILFMTSQVLKFMGWLEIEKNEYMKNKGWFFCKRKKFLTGTLYGTH